ncbi:MAG: response regulator [Xanthomonadales bacterium]|nr:response regulator [Xanthomonadales bacterium]
MLKVLIVDDSPAQVLSICRIIEQAGHQALVAHSGEQAIELANEEKPQVILMDIIMPGMNGYQATRRLSRDERTRNIPVIMVSSRDTETDKAWGIRQGAWDYVTKPVNDLILLNAISSAMAA